ncbi:NAD(P)-binding protein [Punctularia strigosozonata HHB-11173 SS5]|uniref:NAD(P)-binding protein n=1 Tax=Punctularia strigosozonata (strain HHB-11173) TaxID=741275 RepID=UPI00044178AB|nr:NAD(P)-binding protein [Punctularia strigosozonata HHB-11173 SS5]EIN09608.1 NAD(P)-binding protein [Punctularia strigosozonata HHB-11173 SS5]
MTSIIGFFKRVTTSANPPEVPKAENPIRFGILGAANIGPDALIKPAKSHPEVVIAAVAARDKTKAETYAKKWGIQKTYGGPAGYDELLNDPEIDAVYNPLPNGLHYEWTMKALSKGKHVLLEKPSADTAEETRKMFELAEQKGLVLMEAFHYRFHPAVQRAKAILDSGELGAVKSLTCHMVIPEIGFIGKDDIRYNHSLGGGCMMDMGCYPLSAVRFFASNNPVSVLSAEAHVIPPAADLVDKGMSATLAFPNDVAASIRCHFGMPPAYGFIPRMPVLSLKAECEGGELTLSNFVLPTLWHSITVSKREGRGRVTRTEKAYTFKDGIGEPWWTTYRYQLEAFVDKLKGRNPHYWMTGEDSVANMEWIERVYEKSGLGSRPASKFVL